MAESDKPQWGPAERLAYLIPAIRLKLNGTEWAALAVVLNHINSVTGLAWPSVATIEQLTGIDARNLRRAIAGLVEKSVLRIVEHGHRHRSNRYTLNPALAESVGVNLPPYLLGGESTLSNPPPYRMANPPAGRGESAPLVGVNSPPKPSINRASNPRVDDDAPAGEARRAPQGGNADAPPGAPPGGLVGSDKFPDFWKAIGRRTTVKDAEAYLANLLANGAPYADILAGAERYGAYNAATGGKRQVSALEWLKGEKWRDDWAVRAFPPRGQKSPKGKAQQAAPAIKGKLPKPVAQRPPAPSRTDEVGIKARILAGVSPNTRLSITSKSKKGVSRSEQKANEAHAQKIRDILQAMQSKHSRERAAAGFSVPDERLTPQQLQAKREMLAQQAWERQEFANRHPIIEYD